jgi:flagellar biosynthesis/type III secretory pathway protein FliH
MSEEVKEAIKTESISEDIKSEDFKKGFEEGFHKGVVQGYIKGHTDANEENEREKIENMNFFQKIIAYIVKVFTESSLKTSISNLLKAVKSMFKSLSSLATLSKIELEEMLRVEKAKAIKVPAI